LTDIFHIAPLEYPLDNEVGFGVIVNHLKVHIPENALCEYGFRFCVNDVFIRCI
jgi:hypothetical protein